MQMSNEMVTLRMESISTILPYPILWRMITPKVAQCT
jgi:hypothetical protein